MRRWSFASSMQARLLVPLIGMLVLFTIIFIFLTIKFKEEYESTGRQVTTSSAINQHTLELARIRSRMQEVLLLFRITQANKYLVELEDLSTLRSAQINQIQSYSSMNPNWYAQSTSIISGLKESEFLRSKMIEAVKTNNIKKADSAFQQLSTIFEINSSRLRDFTVRLRNDLNNDLADLQNLLVRTFWLMTFAFAGLGFTILLLAIFYRRDVVKPLLDLQRGIQALSAGNFDVAIPVIKSPIEIRNMAVDFNRMALALVRSKKDLMGAREEALTAAQIKSDFLSNMSHEIRTPMNTIVGMADLLGEGKLPPDEMKYVQVLRSSSEMLLNIVNDILDFSRLEQGVTTFENISFDFHDLSLRTSEVIEVVAKQKGLRFKFDFTPDQPFWIQGDPKRFEQIILNLLGNAVKFTDHGVVEFLVDIRPSNSSAKNVIIKIEIVDTGIGIDAGNLDKIFARFSQSDSSITRKYGGTGLGLAIVKKLCDIMGADITVKSAVNKGSQFTLIVELPKANQLSAELQLLPQGESQNDFIGSLSGLKVLLVDDVIDNRLLIDIYFKNTNCTVIEADNGEKAVAEFANNQFDLVLMDMQMPILDGYAATARIREIELMENRKRCCIIALTAYALIEEIERSYKAGCDAHLTKPVRKIALLKLIDELVNSETSLLTRRR